MNTRDNVRMAKMIKVRTIQSKMVKTAKIIKLFHRKTQNHPGRRMLKMAKTGIKGNSSFAESFIFGCVAHAFVLELWQIV